jgi:hypothetical protein
LSSLVIQLQVFFTIFLAFAFFGERPGIAQLGGAGGGALVGIGVIAVERLDGAALLPLLLTIAAAGCWGFGNMVGKAAGRIDMLGFVVWSALIPPIPLLLGLAAARRAGSRSRWRMEHLTLKGIGSIAFMAYIATLVRLRRLGLAAEPLQHRTGGAVRAVRAGGGDRGCCADSRRGDHRSGESSAACWCLAGCCSTCSGRGCSNEASA